MADISIIIPCYNVEKYIMRCFDSLRNQTIGLHRLELIFVDDASTDCTWELLQEIERTAPESVCIVRLENNMRQGGARNIGLSYATAEYIGFVDSDDWIEPDMYEHLYHALTSAGSDLAFCRHIRDHGKGDLYLSPKTKMDYYAENYQKKDRTLYIHTDEQRTEFIVSNIIGYGVWDKLFRKDFLLDNEILFPEHLTYEDIYFGSVVYLYAKQVSIVERRLYHYYVNDESTVLVRNRAHHKDLFQINYAKWNTYVRRGFLERFREALEFDFLMTFFMSGMKVFALRFDQIPFDDFMELKRGTLERVPHFKTNPYCQSHISDFYKLMLPLLEYHVTPSDLDKVQQAFLTYHNLK